MLLGGEMKEQLNNFIENLKECKEISTYDEAATKQGIILQLLSILNWNTFNIDEVSPEYSVKGKRVDYSLRIQKDNKVFIEVKRIGEELSNHQEQLLEYSFQEGVELAILTNGITWWFYLPLQKGSWEQRRFYTIDIIQQETEEIVSKFIALLSKENISSGLAIQNAEEVYKSYKKQTILKETLPEAWKKIISDPDELLIELISETTEKLCGYKPSNEMVGNFIVKNKNRFLISIPTTIRKSPYKPTKVSLKLLPIKESYTGKSISNFYFRNKKYEVRSWKDFLIRLINILYELHSKDFKKVLSLKGRKRPYFTHNSNELRNPQKISRTNIFVETNLNADMIVKICFNLLSIFDYSNSDLRIDCY